MSASIILLAILGLSLLVIVHEAGHYFAARAFGMRVTQFSIGFGPSLVSFQPKGSDTTFQIRAIPFMAYVMIAGMNPAEEFDPNDPTLYPNKSVFARIVTIFAGPFANYLAASLFVLGLGLGVWLARVQADRADGDRGGRARLTGRQGRAQGRRRDRRGRRPQHPQRQAADRGHRAARRQADALRDRARRQAPAARRRSRPRPSADKGIIGVTPKIDRSYRKLTFGETALLALAYPFDLTVRNLEGIARR